jgi:hypothetical protein
MTNEQKLAEASRLIEEVWNDLVPDKPPRTVAEDEYFDFVDDTASRILSDVNQMFTFVLDAQL